MSIQRPEPAFVNDEVTMLREFLDHYRATIRLQASGLTGEQLAQTHGPSDLTLGGMLKHLAGVEDYWFTYCLAGHDVIEPWKSVDWEADQDWDWHSAADDTHAELDALLVAAIARSEERLEAALERGGLDQPLSRERREGQTPTLRWLLIHMVEEYSRHAGHADLIRESIDGATDI
jgi:uncharacterized damage-inducible protein DinB